MSLKRQNTSSAEPEDDQPPAKRQRPAWIDDFDTVEYPERREESRVDISSGQRSAFPGLDDEDNDELIYGDPEDGLQYLRMVRSERQTVPHILVAAQEAQTLAADEGEDEAWDDDEDYHPDRAWIAAPNETLEQGYDDAPDAQELYYIALLERFARTQASLQTPPPLSAIELLTSSQLISFPSEAPKARDKWRRLTLESDPVPTQLACMDPESVLELVRLLTEGMTGIIKSRVRTKVKRLGGWIWATLARFRDRGELSSEEIAELRELGKKAVQMLDLVRRTQTMEVEDQTDHLETAIEMGTEMGEGVGPGEDPDLEKAKAQMASMLDAISDEESREAANGSTIDANQLIHMVLDTTITLVGEVYGQRDLLEHRDVWD